MWISLLKCVYGRMKPRNKKKIVEVARGLRHDRNFNDSFVG